MVSFVSSLVYYFWFMMTNTVHSLNITLPESPLTQSDKIDLLMHLNHLRSNTARFAQPSASNMNFVFWDEALAIISQLAANKCDNQHPDYRHFLDIQSIHSLWEYPNVGGLISYQTSTTNISKQILPALLEEAYFKNDEYETS